MIFFKLLGTDLSINLKKFYFIYDIKNSYSNPCPKIFLICFAFLMGLRLTHKTTVFSHKLCTRFWSSKLSQKKRKTKQSALQTDLVNRHTHFFFPNALIHTQNLLILIFKNLHTELNLKIEIIYKMYAFLKSS